MLVETAKVIAVEADGLWVETRKLRACGQCQAKSGCGQRLLHSAVEDSSLIKAYFNDDSQAGERIWQVGDSVKIGIQEGALLTATLVAYLVPLLSMLLGTAIAANLAWSEGATIAAAAAGLLLGGLASRFGFVRFGTRFDAQILERYNESVQEIERIDSVNLPFDKG